MIFSEKEIFYIHAALEIEVGSIDSRLKLSDSRHLMSTLNHMKQTRVDLINKINTHWRQKREQGTKDTGNDRGRTLPKVEGKAQKESKI